ncbi:MAG TPA: beta galactosidase jelly roll domain-containing protein, partial [Armatimonadota bacterium]
SFIRFARLQPRKWEGINLCCNFGGDALRNLARARELQPDAPLFVTEYWIAAFDWWGRNGTAAYDDANALNGALEIVAGGSGGLTAFVFSGGAHFAYWHGCSICSDNNFMTTLYGPGAPILDDGSFGGKYARFKTHMTGLMSGAAELAQAGMPQVTALGDGLVKSVRTGPQAEFTFYSNQSKEKIQIADSEKDQAAVDMSIPAGAVLWSVKNLPLPVGFRLLESTANLFCADPAVVLYGAAGHTVSLTLACPAATVAVSGEALAHQEGNTVTLDVVVPADSVPAVVTVQSGSARLTVAVVNEDTVTRCWRVELPGAPVVVLGGPDRINDAVVRAGALRLTVSASAARACWQLTADGVAPCAVTFSGDAQASVQPLTQVVTHAAFPEAAPAFADSDWHRAEQPQAMARFGHGQGRAWYRTTFHVSDTGPQTIQFSGAADRALVFVDGQFLAVRGAHTHCGWHVMPYLHPGEHTLALLVENLGMFNSGAEFDVPLGEPKGLYGPVWLNGEEIRQWTMRAGVRADEALEYWPAVATAPDWQPTTAATVPGPCWLRAEFAMPAGFDGAVRLELSHAGKGSVWLNGHNVGRYWKIGPQQSLWLPLSWLQEENTLVLLEELSVEPAQVTVCLQPVGVIGEITLAATGCSA